MEADKEAALQALVNRQERMFNWEDKMKKQEMQFMDQFEQQKNALKAKKLGDQQKELLKDMNQKDVDVMLARHKRELEAIEEALAAEQKRQMDQMKEQMKSRNAKLASEKALRQIKLAEIQKSKLKEA
jgi:chlorite dismutase